MPHHLVSIVALLPFYQASYVFSILDSNCTSSILIATSTNKNTNIQQAKLPFSIKTFDIYYLLQQK